PFPPEAHLRKAVKERRLPRAGRTAVAARDEEGGRAHRPVAQGRVAEPGAAAVVRARRGEVAGVPAPLHGGAEVESGARGPAARAREERQRHAALRRARRGAQQRGRAEGVPGVPGALTSPRRSHPPRAPRAARRRRYYSRSNRKSGVMRARKPASTVNEPVSSRTPTRMSSTPLARLTQGIQRRNCLKPARNRSSASVAARNGIARPAE